jgi:hypothetical protein
MEGLLKKGKDRQLQGGPGLHLVLGGPAFEAYGKVFGEFDFDIHSAQCYGMGRAKAVQCVFKFGFHQWLPPAFHRAFPDTRNILRPVKKVIHSHQGTSYVTCKNSECRAAGLRRPAVTRAVTFDPMKAMCHPSVTRRTKEKTSRTDLLNSLPFSPRRALCGFRYGQRGLRW